MPKRLWWYTGASAFLFTVVTAGLQWWKLAHFGYNGLDLGIYQQVAWSLAHGHGFASSIHDPTYLGDHLELWLVPISWIYRLFPSALTLLWIQTLLIAATVVPLAKLAYHFLGRRGVIVAVVLFVLHPLVYNVALYEFHGLVVALPLLVWSVWWYVKRRYWPWLLALIGVLVVREDMPFVVAGWAILAAIDRRRWRWWLVTFGLAIIWFFTAQAVIKGANHDGLYKYFAFYRWLGADLGEMVTFPFRHPWLFIKHVTSLDNVGTIVGLLVTAGFLPLLRPRSLWPLLVVFVQLLIGGAQPASFLRLHYVIPYLPFLWWATMVAMRDLLAGRISIRGDRSIPAVIGTILVITSPLYSLLIMGPAEWPWSVRRGEETAAIVQRQALADVQPTDRVLTTFNYLPAFAHRTTLYSLNYLYLGRRQYSEIPYRVPSDIDVAVIDWQQLYDYQFLYQTTVFEGRSGLQRINSFLNEQGLGIIKRYGPVAVYRRGGSTDDSVRQLPSRVEAAPISAGPVAIVGQPVAAIVPQPALGWRELVVDSTWEAQSTAQDKPVSVRYVLSANGRVVWEQSRILGQGVTPASEWPVDTQWAVRDILVPPLSLRGTFDLRLEVVIPHGRYRLDRLRTFRPILDREERLGQIPIGPVTL